MTTLNITRRPVTLAVAASASMLTDILARIDAARGRSALYGVSDPVRASLWASETIEADFVEGFYRDAYVYGPDLERLPGWSFSRASAATALTAVGTIVRFASGEPRITDRGLLIEGAATNLILRSEEMDDASWSKSNVTVTANATSGPDPTTGMDKIEATAAGVTTFWQDRTVGVAGASVFSIYVKQGSGPTDANVFGVFNNTAGTNLAFIRFNFDTGAITYLAGAGVSALACPDGVWRLEFRIASGVSNGDSLGFYVGFNGEVEAAGEHCYVTAAQYEAGAKATSYIPTTGSTATRAEDVAEFTALGGAKGSIFCDFDAVGVDGDIATVWRSGDLATDLYIFRASVSAGALLFEDSVNTFTATATIPAGRRRTKVVIGWGNGLLAGAMDGEALTGAAHATLDDLATVRLGNPGFDHLDGYIRRVLVAKRLPGLAEQLAMTEPA